VLQPPASLDRSMLLIRAINRNPAKGSDGLSLTIAGFSEKFRQIGDSVAYEVGQSRKQAADHHDKNRIGHEIWKQHQAETTNEWHSFLLLLAIYEVSQPYRAKQYGPK
jgi:hypothetical protein